MAVQVNLQLGVMAVSRTLPFLGSRHVVNSKVSPHTADMLFLVQIYKVATL